MYRLRGRAQAMNESLLDRNLKAIREGGVRRGTLTLNTEGKRSQCCASEVKVASSGGGMTHWYECMKCGKPCDSI
jgi:hypothetical protein